MPELRKSPSTSPSRQRRKKVSANSPGGGETHRLSPGTDGGAVGAVVGAGAVEEHFEHPPAPAGPAVVGDVGSDHGSHIRVFETAEGFLRCTMGIERDRQDFRRLRDPSGFDCDREELKALARAADVEPPGSGEVGEFLLRNGHTGSIGPSREEPMPGAGGAKV
ncbi:hypothetical protein [Methanoculleus chikugoensis]|uniref:hypothetical protein n=1 Tax=Methanoculleus chikugoensis TaxID=118126 RepID=UPI000AFCA8D1|nr:hypothetical protein [Methanoculleus chikugoensis]